MAHFQTKDKKMMNGTLFPKGQWNNAIIFSEDFFLEELGQGSQDSILQYRTVPYCSVQYKNNNFVVIGVCRESQSQKWAEQHRVFT